MLVTSVNTYQGSDGCQGFLGGGGGGGHRPLGSGLPPPPLIGVKWPKNHATGFEKIQFPSKVGCTIFIYSNPLRLSIP